MTQDRASLYDDGIDGQVDCVEWQNSLDSERTMVDLPEIDDELNQAPTDQALGRLQFTTLLYYLHESNPRCGQPDRVCLLLVQFLPEEHGTYGVKVNRSRNYCRGP